LGTKCCGFELAVTCAKQTSASSSCGKKGPSKGGPGVACFLAKLSPVWLGKMPLSRFHIKKFALFPVSSCWCLQCWKKIVAFFLRSCRLSAKALGRPLKKVLWILLIVLNLKKKKKAVAI